MNVKILELKIIMKIIFLLRKREREREYIIDIKMN